MEITNILKLANLKLNADEESRIAKDLQEVIDFNINKLKNVDVSGVEPTFQVEVQSNALGDDEPEPSLAEAEVFLNTDQKKNSSFRVKAVFE